MKLDDLTSQARNRGREDKTQFVPPKKAQNQGQNDFKKQSQPSCSWNPAEVYGVDTGFTLFKTSISEIFSAIQDQSMLRHPWPLLPNTKDAGAGYYCAFHDEMVHRTINYRHL